MVAAGFSRVKAGPLVFEPSPRWVRARIGDVTVVDSKQVLLLWEEGKTCPSTSFRARTCAPNFCVRARTRCPRPTTGSPPTYTLEVDGRVAENTAWSYSAAPPPEGERLADYVAFEWEAMDT